MAVIGATAARAAQSLQTVDIDVDLVNDTYKVAGIEYKLAEGTDKAGVSGIPFVILPRGARVLGGSVFTQEQIVAGDAVVGIDLLDPDTNTLYFRAPDARSTGARPMSSQGILQKGQPTHLRLSGVAAAKPITKGKITVNIQFLVSGRSEYVMG